MRSLLLIALAGASCSSQASSGTPVASASRRDARPAAVAPAVSDAAPAAAAPAPAADAGVLVTGSDGIARGPIPSALDPRVAEILAEPVPDAVVVRFAEIARGGDPTANARWDLDRSGRLFFVRHSDDATARAPFDRPLPSRVSLRLDAAHQREVMHALDVQKFFEHPGYETLPGATGGTTVIVRARRPGQKDLHTVVYDVSRPELLDFLEVVTVKL
jgi:hypothetical protein